MLQEESIGRESLFLLLAYPGWTANTLLTGHNKQVQSAAGDSATSHRLDAELDHGGCGHVGECDSVETMGGVRVR
jgi:hypothetical protein